MNKLVRPRVIINKYALELLSELNRQADKVGAVVFIGVLPSDSEVEMGKTATDVAVYVVCSYDKDDKLETQVCLNKEEVYKTIISMVDKQTPSLREKV